ncbi:MAG: hypothetical protein AAB897_04090 [Patescibacteria group bacterium]
MALPQKVLEQLSREPPKTPGWAGQFLMFSGTIFFIALLVYLGLAFGYRPYLVSEVAQLQDQINSFGQQIPAEEQAKIINFYSQLLNIRTLLSRHVFSSKAFEWLEANTQARVYFDKFDFNAKNSEVRLGGLAKTMEDVNQQLAIFDSRPEIKKANTSNVTLSNNIWRFDVTLTFDPGFFRSAAEL